MRAKSLDHGTQNSQPHSTLQNSTINNTSIGATTQNATNTINTTSIGATTQNTTNTVNTTSTLVKSTIAQTISQSMPQISTIASQTVGATFGSSSNTMGQPHQTFYLGPHPMLWGQPHQTILGETKDKLLFKDLIPMLIPRHKALKSIPTLVFPKGKTKISHLAIFINLGKENK